MRSGGFNRLITLTPPHGALVGRDEFNAPIYSAPTPVDALAEYVPGSGSEKMASGEVRATASLVFRVRWTPGTADVVPTWSLTFGGRMFNIISAIEEGHRDAILITAAARAE